MVHGGGHHHHSGGGGGSSSMMSGGGWGGGNRNRVGWGGGSWGGGGWGGPGWGGGGWGGPGWGGPGWGGWGHGYQNPNVVVVNQNRGASDSEECERCCRNLCLGCCIGYGAASLTQNASQNREGIMREDRGSTGNCRYLFCPWSFLSMLVFVILLGVSNVNETWTLNSGESRRIPSKAFWNHRIRIASQIPNGIRVYDIVGPCPPLTGPTIPLDQSWSITLAPDDYQFDYFYLNKGSVLTVTYQQHKGATNISILKGSNTLASLRSGEVDSESKLLTRYAGASQQAVFAYTVPETDTYILLYDNASTSTGKATVTLHADLATYDLQKQQAFSGCFALDCIVKLSGNDCLILQAQPGTTSSEINAKITADRHWFLIGAIALLPLIAGICLYQQRRSRIPQEDAPLAHDKTTPTAPEATSDIVVDYESIPIAVAEDMYPVAVPVGAKLTPYD